MLSGFNPGAILSSDPKQHKPQKTIHFLKSLAGSMFNAFLSTKSKTHSVAHSGPERGKKTHGGGKEVEKVTNLKGIFKKFENVLLC